MVRKSANRKARLVKANRKSKSVPVFVRMRTARRVSTTPARRHWRTKKLKSKD